MMNAGKNKGSLVSIGIPSIFLIFTVLTMSILAVLTFMVSRTDQAESALALEQTQAYYAACSRAADVITLFQKAWNEDASAEPSDGEAVLRKGIRITQKLLKENRDLMLRMNEETCQLELTVPYTDKLSLIVLARLPDRNRPGLTVSRWQSVYTGEWEADTSLSVYHNQ